MVVKKSNRKNVYRLSIDPKGKQVLVVRGANIPEEDFAEFVQKVQEWGKSDDPILVVQISATVEIQLVRSVKHGRA